ncbi:MAG: AbrB/MazE/SpoVT family DNA-binding domain-containing protein [Elusimicrobiota bacterium]|nr:AbrB/MazE/SpoVT family DNA-binding domain-containing protein [Elusimicrobiota bacterium]
MMTKITIDKAGRVVIPKSLRDELHLTAGDRLQLESSGDAITLRPVPETAPLQKEQGFWVYRTGHPLKDLSIPDWIDKGREERNHRIAG